MKTTSDNVSADLGNVECGRCQAVCPAHAAGLLLSPKLMITDLHDLEISVKPGAFGARRCVVELTFTDQPEGTQRWWFLNEDGRAQLCVKSPGFEVDLYLVTTLPDMIYIYRGDLPLAQRRLEAHGAAWAHSTLSHWLASSPLASVKSRRPDTQVA